ncbi:Immunoglobulin-binding protein 1 [Gracilariopsis chorda]|uniref:Immunoglobulin-binding protein 1 n=1 Tax=Gracilariopsis chorda TaxID=448386 RepID=A0A2V3IDS7_9FLOR|nr:Immunoglobulin-binding protein 1 [Gracilariopsis chorda]|eukprot:PXF40224.1 Immunoglobulin-binding protein 1 [Gracilariopsis chorda]
MAGAAEDKSLGALFSDAVFAVTSAAGPWPALTYLANAPQPVFAPSTRPEPGKSQPADAAIDKLQILAETLRLASLFSRNEQLDEIPTPHIKFMIVPYLSALAFQAWQGEAAERLNKLVRCDAELQTFFSDVDAYALLTESQRDYVLQNTPEFVQTPMQKREEKIARLKMEKAAEKQLQNLMEKLEKRSATDDDDTDLRHASIIVLQSAVRRALDMFSSLQEEIEILRFAERQRSKGVDPRVKAEQARPKRPPPGIGDMPPTFRIVNEREQERAAVFRPSHSLPTYTIEEWGEIEARRLARVEREKKEKEIAAKRRKEDEDSDDDEAVERATMEARRWDDWKDEHNRGSGNTIR